VRHPSNEKNSAFHYESTGQRAVSFAIAYHRKIRECLVANAGASADGLA
jgi:hypothetical protein